MPQPQRTTTEQQLEQRLAASGLGELEQSVVRTYFRSQGLAAAARMIARFRAESMVGLGQMRLFGREARS